MTTAAQNTATQVPANAESPAEQPVPPASLQKSILKGVQPAVTLQALNRGDLLLRHRPDPGKTGARRVSVDQDRARSTLTFTASLFRAGQIQVVPENTQKCSLRIGINRAIHPVHTHLGCSFHR